MRMIVFPYGHDCEPIIRHINLLEPRYEIAALVSPGGWGFAGKNIMLGSGIALTVHETMGEVVEEFDSLFIPPFEAANEKVESRLVDEMIKLVPRLSDIVCAARLTEANRQKLEQSCCQPGSSCVFSDLSEHKNAEDYGLEAPTEEYPSLRRLDVPIVVVAGTWEKTDKFEISLSLRERLLQDGYQVSQIGSRDGCEMLGFHSFPGFMLSKDMDASDKIVCFNRWVWQMVRKEQPDLVLITVPGATQDFNGQFTRGFGILHHQVFQAVTPDILIMCTFYMTGSKDILENMSTFCKYRFGATVDAFHMSNLFVDINDSEQRNRIVTNSIYRETVSQAISQCFADSQVPVFNGVDSLDCDRMYHAVIEKLMPKEVRVVS